jgi:hypothetical protein
MIDPAALDLRQRRYRPIPLDLPDGAVVSSSQHGCAACGYRCCEDHSVMRLDPAGRASGLVHQMNDAIAGCECRSAIAAQDRRDWRAQMLLRLEMRKQQARGGIGLLHRLLALVVARQRSHESPR